MRNAVGTWHEDANGWWFEYSGGGNPSNTWEEIDNHWYYFNGSGYMVTGMLHTMENGSGLIHEFNSDWCWVATAEMVGKYVNPSSAQTQNSVVASMVLKDFDIPGFTFMANIA